MKKVQQSVVTAFWYKSVEASSEVSSGFQAESGRNGSGISGE